MNYPIFDAESLDGLYACLELLEMVAERTDDPDVQADLENIIQALITLLDVAGNA